MPLTRSEARKSRIEDFAELKDPEPPKSKRKPRRPTLDSDIAQDEEYATNDSYEAKANKKIIKAKKSLLKGEQESAPADALQRQEGQIGTIIEDRDLARGNINIGLGKGSNAASEMGRSLARTRAFQNQSISCRGRGTGKMGKIEYWAGKGRLPTRYPSHRCKEQVAKAEDAFKRAKADEAPVDVLQEQQHRFKVLATDRDLCRSHVQGWAKRYPAMRTH